MENKKTALICAAAALAVHFLMALAFIRASAPTYDESVHLASGYSVLSTGRYDMVPTGHPPLAQVLGAAPLLVYKPHLFLNHPYFLQNMAYHYADLFLYENTLSAEKLLNTARIFVLFLWSGLLAVFIWLLASGLGGAPSAAASVAVFSLMPIFISNDAIVATDGASAAFFIGAFLFGYKFSSLPAESGKNGRRENSRSRYIYAGTAGLLTGLALVSKFSMFVIPPVILALWVGLSHFERKLRTSRLFVYSAVYLLAAFAAVALVYRFRLDLYASGLADTFTMVDKGRSSFAWGRHSLSTIWWYFPFALLVKTPLAVTALALAGLASILKRFKKDHLWLLLPPLLYFAASMHTKVQIGVRHLMPVMPFLAVTAGLGAVWAMKRKVLAALLGPLLFLWGYGLLKTGPHYLAYFNELAGGPENGFNMLTDSNLDWGQDIKGLSGWLGEHGNPPVVLSYFGTARPEYYGMKYTSLAPYTNIELKGTGADLCRSGRLLFAVSATNLQSTYYPDQHTYDWLKDRKPLYTAGYSIFLYDLTGDREGEAKLAEVFDRYGMNTEADCLYSRSRKQ